MDQANDVDEADLFESLGLGRLNLKKETSEI